MWGECSGNLAKASVSVAWDEKIRNGEPGREECGTDHLSVIGAGGRKGKRDKQLSSGDSKKLSGRGAGLSARFTNKGLNKKRRVEGRALGRRGKLVSRPMQKEHGARHWGRSGFNSTPAAGKERG